jgi:hypothetical protein
MSSKKAALLRLWRVDAERVIAEEAILLYEQLGGNLNLRAICCGLSSSAEAGEILAGLIVRFSVDAKGARAAG